MIEIETVYDKLEKLINQQQEKFYSDKTETEILEMFLRGCQGQFDSTTIKKLERVLQDFNGDKWELAGVMVPVISGAEKPATATIVANLVMYIFQKGHPIDLSAVIMKDYCNLDVVTANFSRFRREKLYLF